MINKVELLEPEVTYHIYNRANGNENLFQSDDNYSYFLRKYTEYISPIAYTYCYCLMPNHFHFLIRIKSEKELKSNFQGFINLENFVSKQFSNFFNSYTKSYNKQQNGKGNLFMHNFKRKKIGDESYLRKIVHYIHFNPVEAEFCKLPSEWKYSSYNALVISKPTLLNKEEVIKWFDDLVNFIYIHENPPKYTGIDIGTF